MRNTEAMESSPAGLGKATIREVAKGRKLITELRSLLVSLPHDDPRTKLADELFGRISTSLTSALTALEAGDFPAENKDDEESITGPRAQSSKSRRRRKAKDSWTEEETSAKDDRHQWRKYGQKMIHEWSHPRFDPPDQTYYRCNNRGQQECQARKKVQQRDYEGKSIFMGSFSNQLTCKTMPKSHELRQEFPQGEQSVLRFEPNTNVQKDIESEAINANKSSASSSTESIHAELGMREISASTSDSGDTFPSMCFSPDFPDSPRMTDAMRLDTWPEFGDVDWFQAPN